MSDFVVSSAIDIEISRKKLEILRKKNLKILVSVNMLDTGFDCESGQYSFCKTC